MRIHSDTIGMDDLHRLTPAGCYLEATAHASRKRDHAFEVGMSAMHGTDSHGIKRCYARNTGNYGGGGDYDRAATWVEWGDFICELFKIDPGAIIGTYEEADSFVYQTERAAPHRQARENAVDHAQRWREELGYAQVMM